MTIDWTALGIVAVVSIVGTVAFVALLSAGIRLVSQATAGAHQTTHPAGVRAAGYGMLGLAGVVVLYGLYLIVPAFH